MDSSGGGLVGSAHRKLTGYFCERGGAKPCAVHNKSHKAETPL